MTYFDNKNIFVNEFNILLHMNLLLVILLIFMINVIYNHTTYPYSIIYIFIAYYVITRIGKYMYQQEMKHVGVLNKHKKEDALEHNESEHKNHEHHEDHDDDTSHDDNNSPDNDDVITE